MRKKGIFLPSPNGTLVLDFIKVTFLNINRGSGPLGLAQERMPRYVTIKTRTPHLTLNRQRLCADKPSIRALPVRRQDPVFNLDASYRNPIDAHVVSLAGLRHRVDDRLVLSLRVPIGRILYLDLCLGGVRVVY